MTESGFSTPQAARITGATVRQLSYWRKTALVVPSAYSRGGHARYVFADLIAIRAARQLIDAGIPLQRIRKSLTALIAFLPQARRPLSELAVVATGDTVLVFQGESAFEALTGQEWILDIAQFQREVERRAGEPSAPVQADLFEAPNAVPESVPESTNSKRRTG